MFWINVALCIVALSNQRWPLHLTANSLDAGNCPERFFQCKNSTLCVSQDSNCDSKIDCPDGSDEDDCDDRYDMNFYDHMYRKRPAAEHDDLDDNCLLPYNGSCVCRSRDILCHYKNYHKVPEDLPQEYVDLLDLSGNNFDVLSVDSLKSLPTEVKTLGLAHCGITEMEEGTFYNLSSLRVLRLENNDLQVFPSDLFPTENNLQILVASYNKLTHIDDNAFRELSELTELDLSENRLTEIRREVLEPLIALNTLYLKGNRIRTVDKKMFPRLPLVTLSLTENYIETLGIGTFSSVPTLQGLYLSNNRLTYLSNGTFSNLNELKSLNLNDNSIKLIEVGVFHDTKNLTSLNLERNAFKTFDKPILKPLKQLSHVYFDRFEMCLAATHVRVCLPKGDGISSQEHLLDNPVLRASVWIMGAIGCTGNLIVLLGRLLAPTNNVVHSLYIRNLALSDLLMGVYLFTIAGADHHYRGVYLQHEFTWRHSYLCNLCGFLSTLSCESSVLILSLVTWDRFVSVTQPLARKQPSPRTAALTLILLWMIAATVALAPLTKFSNWYFGEEFYGSNGVCLSLHIHDPYAMGWEYSAAMFICVNALALAFICYAYCKMISEIRASGVACRSTQQSQERDRVAQRFGIIVFTDCACWVPIIIVKLTALSGIPISKDLYAWLAILVLPINSALNPVLYTLTTTMFRKQMRKMINSCVYKRRRTDHQNSGYDSAFSLSFGVFPIGGSTRRILSYRATQSSLTASKNSWRRPTAV